MKTRTAIALLGLLLFLGVGLPAATTSFPVDELKPGMVGGDAVALTVPPNALPAT